MNLVASVSAAIVGAGRAVWRLIAGLVFGIFWFLQIFIGRIDWQAPGWMRALPGEATALSSSVRARPARAAVWLGGALVAGAAAWFGLHWWLTRPQPALPERITVEVTAPALTTFDAEGKATIAPLTLTFSGSAAAIEWAGKPVTRGVTIEPAIAGQWHFNADRELVFEPAADWPIDTEFTVRLARQGLLNPVRNVSTHQISFRTEPFKAQVESAEFYQDPTVVAQKKAIFTLAFTHAVNPRELEQRLQLRRSGQSTGVLGLGGETTAFTVQYDRLRLKAFVHSAVLAIPEREQRLVLTVDDGVRAERGGNGTRKELTGTVVVPGRYSLAVENVEPTLVDNERMEPEQVLVLATNQLVGEQPLAAAVKAWVLPQRHPTRTQQSSDSDYSWSDAAEVSTQVLAKAESLPLEAVPAEHEFVQSLGLKYHAEVGRYIYVTVQKGLRSFGGYELAQSRAYVFRVPPYPADLRILHSGALLTLSGEKRVGVMSRDVARLKVIIGRLLPEQLQHLVSQSYGGFAAAEFGGQINDQNLTERFERVIDVSGSPAGKPHYEGIELGPYLEGVARRGVFVLSVQTLPPLRQQPDGRWVENYDNYEYRQDRRLILVTDLGVLAKRSLDGTRDLFVQSIQTGDPVAEATVKVLGKNGQAIVTTATDATGRARLPKLDDFQFEREPLLYVVEKGADLSFLPIERSDRELDLSRFDVGGADNASQAGQLSAYLFSERGLYRPGEEVHVGMIVRPAVWGSNIQGLPVEAVVTDPRGLTVKRQKLQLSRTAFESLDFRTTESAPTGTYTISLGLLQDQKRWLPLGSTSVNVREFQPDRMKVSARLTQAATPGWVSPAKLGATVNVQNLFGTAAENRRVEGTLTLKPAFPAFPRYRDYVFYDPLRAKEGFAEPLEAQTTGKDGTVQFTFGLERFAQATYELQFVARAFESEGGRGVTAQTTALVSAAPHLVGWKADGDLGFVARGTVRTIDFIAIDPQLNRIALGALKLERVARRQVSVLAKQPNGAYKYESQPKETLLDSSALTIAAAGQQLTLDATTPGDYALIVRDAQGQALNRVDYSIAGQGNVARSLERNAELVLKLDSTSYAPGSEIDISIRAPYTGSGLITIERDKVYAHAWFRADTTSSVQRIKLPAGLEGNGYVFVQFLRDPASDEIFMSPLSYGAVPFAVDLDKRRSKLTVATPERVKPGDTVTFKVSASKPSRVAVFAVDEGILQVARYQAPDPLGHFFAKKALQVRTSQILDLVLPEFRKLMGAMAPGGDEEGGLGQNLNPFRRKGEPSVVYWSGLVDVGPDGRALTWTVPESFNGTLRVLAVAVDPETVGTYDNRITVRGDFVLSPNAPLSVAPGDEFDVSAGVANNLEGSGANAKPEVKLAVTGGLEIVGERVQRPSIAENAEGVARFRVRAKAAPGPATLSFDVSLGKAGAHRSTSLSVRPATPRVTTITTGQVEPGRLSGGKIDVPLTRELYAELRDVEAAAATTPLVLGRGLVAYLTDYEHLCTEQIVSQALPIILLTRDPELARRAIDAERARNQTWPAFIDRLRARQAPDGGFPVWYAGDNSEFISAYTVQMLLEARDRGLEVPADMLESGTDYLSGLASTDAQTLSGARARAYAIYLLTRQGRVTTNLIADLERVLDERFAKRWRSDLTAGYLAATYSLLQQQRAAVALLPPLEQQLKKPYVDSDWFWDDYLDPLIRDAVVVQLLARHFPDRLPAVMQPAVARLTAQLRAQRYNTLSSSMTLLALDAIGGSPSATAVTPVIAEVLSSGAARTLTTTGTRIRVTPVSPDAKRVQFAAAGSEPVWYTLTEAGFDRAPPAKATGKGLEVFREYRDAKGSVVTSAAIGQDLTVHVRVRMTDPKLASELAIVDLLPGGFEPVVETGEGTNGLAGSAGSWQPNYVDVREDRVVLYGYATGDLGEFVYHVRPTAAGSFVVPPVTAESMYVRGQQAQSASGKFEVMRP